jgi:hypothetical protein
MQVDVERVALSKARVAYELGRVRVALVRGAFAATVVGIVGAFAVGSSAVVWLPLAFAVVVVTEWRGSALARGARRGTVAGVVSLLMPVALLRPCCVAGMDMTTCCASSSMCLAAGGAFGLVAALFVPKVAAEKRWNAVAGMAVAVTAVGVVRCAPLFLGESLGLLAGLFGGIVATSAARAWLDGMRTG